MNIICTNGARFIIEFTKLFLVVIVFFKIRQYKSIFVSFVISLFALMYASILFDVSKFSIIYGVVAIVLLIVNAYEKKKAGVIILSYIGISILDMIFTSLCIVIFHLSMDEIHGNHLLSIGLNSFSLVWILIVSFILYKRQTSYRQVRIKKYLSIYLIGGISLSLYLTSVQFMGMEEKISTYRYSLVLGLSLSSLVLIVLCVLLIINSNDNEHLKREAEINSNLVKAQKEYYAMLLQKENETKAFRHDIREHVYCMNNLYNNKKYKELGKYLADIDDKVEKLSSKIQTGNGLITAMINDISIKFPEVSLKWMGMIPDELKISSVDLCTVFYNLLSNAFEASQKTDECVVDVKIKFMESTMMVTIMNPIEKEPKVVNGEFISSKCESGHGYGIGNVKRCIEKNKGLFSVIYKDGYFITEIILPCAL